MAHTRHALPLALAFMGAFTEVVRAEADPLVVHEWGTFTCLQDEDGKAIGGVNSEEEPLPRFAHNLALMLIIGTPVQGAPKCHPDVTMRLETPVIYFHPPAGAPNPLTVDVSVRFRGGWLTQFYPNAEADAPGLKSGDFSFGRLTASTIGTLAWRGLKVGGGAAGPATLDRVWTAPRQVKAAGVTTASGESEQFLFYRGVGHIDSPLRVERTKDGRLQFRSQVDRAIGNGELSIPQVWLADIRADSKTAFAALGGCGLGGNPARVLFDVASGFEGGAYAEASLRALRDELRGALLKDGLFADEAEALLNTWEVSYFKSPGLRVFFIAPRAWTDHYLPLEVSAPHQLARVIVGRIELMTPQWRELARNYIQAHPDVNIEDAQRIRLDMKAQLGRFADAIILDTRRR